MNNKILVSASILLGLVFIVIAVVYWVTPAGSLPTIMPGYEPGVIGVHTKHGIASLLLGLALLIFAWFKSARKKQAN